MHILIDRQLKEWGRAGGITPFYSTHINPASIDVSLGETWRDMERPNELRSDTLVLYPRTASLDIYNRFAQKRLPTAVLVTTHEIIHLQADEAASIKLKTTPSREGLGHPIADWVDPGFMGELTLMLHAHKKIELIPGRLIAQLVIFKLDEPAERPYNLVGHYHGQRGPTVSWREK